MKIVVTSKEGSVDSAVDPRFGRARYFVVADTESDEVSVVDNEQNLNAAQGAGIQAAANVGKTGAKAVLTGNVGPKAFATLTAAGIQVCIGVEGTVKDAIARYKTGELKPTEDANVEGHWT